jgi:hypothetical protein
MKLNKYKVEVRFTENEITAAQQYLPCIRIR